MYGKGLPGNLHAMRATQQTPPVQEHNQANCICAVNCGLKNITCRPVYADGTSPKADCTPDTILPAPSNTKPPGFPNEVEPETSPAPAELPPPTGDAPCPDMLSPPEYTPPPDPVPSRASSPDWPVPALGVVVSRPAFACAEHANTDLGTVLLLC